MMGADAFVDECLCLYLSQCLSDSIDDSVEPVQDVMLKKPISFKGGLRTKHCGRASRWAAAPRSGLRMTQCGRASPGYSALRARAVLSHLGDISARRVQASCVLVGRFASLRCLCSVQRPCRRHSAPPPCGNALDQQCVLLLRLCADTPRGS